MKVSDKQMDAYYQGILASHLDTLGGSVPLYNISINDWLDSLNDNLVAIDRKGDPLYYAITATTLPYLPLDTLRDTANVVEEAVKHYYVNNLYPGCTSIDSPNFNYIANVDDGTCNEPFTNHSFGGLFQNCSGKWFFC